MDKSMTTEPQSLAAICAKAFSMIITLGSGHNLGDFKALRSRVMATFGEIEKRALEEGHTAEDVRMARYAVTAFIDETISRTDWEGKTQWMQNPLSLECFGDSRAGDEFFNKLEDLRRQADTKSDLLEVYYTCLALGFEGKYALADPQGRRDLIAQVGRDLERVRPGASELSPNWRPPEALAQLVGGQLPLGIIAVVAVGIVCVVFIVLNFLLSGQAERLAETIIRFGS